MNKYIKGLLILWTVFLLAGCKNEIATVSTAQSLSVVQTQSVQAITQEQLFKAPDMDSIELTGQQVLEGKVADMRVNLSDGVIMDFHIARDNPNGMKLYAVYNNQAINFAMNYISPEVFDEQGEAIADYTYQIACYDFNKEGTKEVVIACGNKKDALSLFVFEANLESEHLFVELNYIVGDTTAYVNSSNEICVPAQIGEKSYLYNVKAYDAQYAKLTGPLKVSVEYATQQQLQKYKNANQFTIQEEGAELLILPKEALKDFRITYVEYDGDNDKFNEVNELYTLPEITPDKPLILKCIMPDLPGLKVSYIEQSGMKQSCVIAESGMDGSIFLIEQGID